MMMDPALEKAISDQDLERLCQVLAAGVRLDQPAEGGFYPLGLAIRSFKDLESRHAALRLLLDSGADPRQAVPGSRGPLDDAWECCDDWALEFLLRHGADPNLEDDDGHALLDDLEMDYEVRAYSMKFPEEPSEEDQATFENWLAFLDALALRHNRPRPVQLFLFRRYGAKTDEELRERT